MNGLGASYRVGYLPEGAPRRDSRQPWVVQRYEILPGNWTTIAQHADEDAAYEYVRQQRVAERARRAQSKKLEARREPKWTKYFW